MRDSSLKSPASTGSSIVDPDWMIRYASRVANIFSGLSPCRRVRTVCTTSAPPRQRAISVGNHFGRILQVGVHVDHGVAGGRGHAGEHAFGHAEAPRHVQDLDARIPFALAEQEIERASVEASFTKISS